MTFFLFSLFMSVYVYVSLCDCVCLGLLLQFLLGFCLFVFVWLFCLFLCFLFRSVCVCFFVWFSLFSFPFTIWFGVLSVRIFVFFLFFQAGWHSRVLVLQLGVGPEPLRWKSRVQDIGPPETSWPHVISIGKSFLRDRHLNTKTQLHLKASKIQCWMPHAKQLTKQEQNTTD